MNEYLAILLVFAGGAGLGLTALWVCGLVFRGF